MHVVAVSLVRNEDVFVERMLRNIAGFCDRIFVADHMSNDDTWEIVSALSRELDHLEAVRVSHAARSQDLIAPYIGTDTWVFSPDGDELFDSAGLELLRPELEAGRYREFFRIKPATLHCVELDEKAMTARGYLAPPSASGAKLWNFAALESWAGVSRERLHDGHPEFRGGWEWDSLLPPSPGDFDRGPFRCLHTCFLRRSSRDPDSGPPRMNLGEINSYRRDAVGRLAGFVRRAQRGNRATPSKQAKYRGGPVVSRDVTPFLEPSSG